jgi:hypothetical protein
MSEAPVYYTVEEASRFLTCAQPVPLPILQQLGKDASLFCRIRQIGWVDKPVLGKRWPSERGYAKDVILEVFRLSPAVRDFVPQG